MMIFHGQFVCCFSVRNNKLSGDGEPARIIKKIHIEGPAAAGGITTRQLQVSCVQRRVAAGGLGCKACSAGGGRAGTMLRTCVFVFSSSLFAEPTRRRITRSSSSSDNQLLRTCFFFALLLSQLLRCVCVDIANNRRLFRRVYVLRRSDEKLITRRQSRTTGTAIDPPSQWMQLMRYLPWYITY